MQNELDKVVANREEIKPLPAKSELPLVFFTLLAQTAVGLFWSAQWLYAPFWNQVQPDSFFLRFLPIGLAGLCLAIGMLISFAHLGAKSNVWRVLNNLGKSWLSKEILAVGLFGAGGLLFVISPGILSGGLVSLLGYNLIYCMANVYRLRSMAVWNSWRTMAGFTLSALLLGHNLLVLLMEYESGFAGVLLPALYFEKVGVFSIILLGLELVLLVSNKASVSNWMTSLRLFMIVICVAALLGGIFMPPAGRLMLSLLVFLMLALQEGIGRGLFYSELSRRVL